jgi:hypothetical protein
VNQIKEHIDRFRSAHHFLVVLFPFFPPFLVAGPFLADGLADPWADPEAAGDALLAPTFFPPLAPFLPPAFLMLLEPAAAFLGALLVVCLAATLAINKVSDHVKSSKNSHSPFH